MAFNKRTWVNVPDPSNYDGDLNSLPRFDADNMNRIEGGVEEAITSSKTAYVKGESLLSINKNGLYYGTEMIDLPPTNSLHTGFIRVVVRNEDYRVIYWRPYNSYVEYTNVLNGGKWLGWTEIFTNKGGTFTNDLEIKKATSPAINIRTNNGLSQIFRNSSDTVDGGLVLKDYLKGEDMSSYVSLVLNHADPKDSQLSFGISENGVRNYYKVFGEHNRDSMRIPCTQTRTYTGSGTGNSVTLTFDFVPKIVFIQSKVYKREGSMAIMINGVASINTFPYSGTTGAASESVTWNGKSVTFTTNDEDSNINNSGETYYCVALG